MTRQPNAIDFWRGFALVTIFINHIPGLFFERFTQKNFSFSDSRRPLRLSRRMGAAPVGRRPGGGTSTGRVLTRLGGRVITIYAAQLLLSSLAIAMLAGAATYFEKPVLLTWFNVCRHLLRSHQRASGPGHAHLSAWLFRHPAALCRADDRCPIDRADLPLVPAALLPVSLAIYLWALVFEVSPPTWPTKGTWFFNPLAWQFLFVLGFLFAGEEGLGGFVRRHQQRLMLIAAPVLLAATLMMLFKWWPGAGDVPEPTLLFTVEKSYLTPIRLIQFLSLAVVFAGV